MNVLLSLSKINLITLLRFKNLEFIEKNSELS